MVLHINATLQFKIDNVNYANTSHVYVLKMVPEKMEIIITYTLQNFLNLDLS